MLKEPAPATLELDDRRLFDEIPCYLTVQDRDFLIRRSNRRFREEFGDGIGRHCYEAYKRRPDRCVVCPVAQTFEDGRVHSSEELVETKDGEKINVLVYTTPILDDRNRVLAVMEMSTNITEVKQLQDKLANLGFLVAGISHSIKSILTGLEGGIYVVDSGFSRRNDEVVQKGWDMLRRNVERISHMVLDILYCSRDRTPDRVPVSPERVLDDVVELFRQKARGRGVALLKEIEPLEGELEADPKGIHSLLASLVENALDACLMDDGKDNHSIVLSVGSSDGEIVFRVTDNGVGMAEETRERLFSNIYTTKDKSGTGLGLFIANKIVKEHGGNIHVESVQRKGTTVTVRLPALGASPRTA